MIILANGSIRTPWNEEDPPPRLQIQIPDCGLDPTVLVGRRAVSGAGPVFSFTSREIRVNPLVISRAENCGQMAVFTLGALGDRTMPQTAAMATRSLDPCFGWEPYSLPYQTSRWLSHCAERRRGSMHQVFFDKMHNTTKPSKSPRR